MKNNIPLSQDGFTIVEVLLYLGLFAIIMIGVISVAFVTFEGNGRLQTKNLIQEEGNFLLAKINTALAGATSVSTPGFGSSDNILVFMKGVSTLTFNFSSGNLTLKTTGSAVPLNNSNVTVLAPTASPTFVFTHTGSVGGLESVTASFTLQTKTPNGQTFSQDFTTTKYLRK